MVELELILGRRLNIEIGGSQAGTDFDQLVVTGRAMLDGTLNVMLINGFIPNPGSSFEIMIFADASGSFATMTLPTGSSLTTPFDGMVQF